MSTRPDPGGSMQPSNLPPWHSNLCSVFRVGAAHPEGPADLADATLRESRTRLAHAARPAFTQAATPATRRAW